MRPCTAAGKVNAATKAVCLRSFYAVFILFR